MEKVTQYKEEGSSCVEVVGVDDGSDRGFIPVTSSYFNANHHLLLKLTNFGA